MGCLLRTHVLARLVLGEQELELAGFSLGVGALAGSPGADLDGVTVPVQARRGRVRTERVDDLAARPGWWEDLANCL